MEGGDIKERLIIQQIEPFYDLSVRIANGGIKEIAPPFLSYNAYKGDIISYCKWFFDEYNKYLYGIDKEVIDRVNIMMEFLVKSFREKSNSEVGNVSFDLIKEVRCVEEMIVKTLSCEFNGFPGEASSVMKNFFEENDNHMLMLLPQIEVSGLTAFRVRPETDEKVSSRKDLFHVPFEQRYKCGFYRYSIPGYPSLYLSKELKVSVNEFNIESGKPYYASCFRSNGALRFIDLACSLDKFWEQYSLLVYYPLIMACGLKVKNPGKPFHPEYVIPQILTQVIRGFSDIGPFTFNGISYISTRLENPNYLDLNQRNFVLWVNEADQEVGYSKSLSDLFRMTLPQRFDDIDNLDDKQMQLSRGEFLSAI